MTLIRRTEHGFRQGRILSVFLAPCSPSYRWACLASPKNADPHSSLDELCLLLARLWMAYHSASYLNND